MQHLTVLNCQSWSYSVALRLSPIQCPEGCIRPVFTTVESIPLTLGDINTTVFSVSIHALTIFLCTFMTFKLLYFLCFQVLTERDWFLFSVALHVDNLVSANFKSTSFCSSTTQAHFHFLEYLLPERNLYNSYAIVSWWTSTEDH